MFFITLMLSGLILVTPFFLFAQTSTPQPPASAEPTAAQKRQEAFELVWKTVNDRFYDPTFNGVDWQKVRERYAPLIARAQSDQEVHVLLQQMLSELHQSHFLIIPREAIPKLAPRHEADDESDDWDDEELATLENAESTTPLDRIGYKMTERLSTGIGIDLRVMNGAAVITRVEPASAAARAGLRPGYVIKSVSGKSLQTAIARYQSNPTFQSVFRGELPVILLAGFINGERQSPLNIVYLDGRNVARTIKLQREKLKGEMSLPIGNLPAMYTEFQAKKFPGGYGYIRFNAFVPNEMKKVCAALRAMHDAPGLVIDLRGNQGGLLGMVSGLTGLLSDKPVVVGTMRTRAGPTPLMAFPQRAPYKGGLVVLIDGSSQSAAEVFAGGLQESGRALVVGQQSAGNALPSTIIKLPTGALFQFGFADYTTVLGNRIEGLGVAPDVRVALTRRSLLSGGDPQLTAAMRKVRQQALLLRSRRAEPVKELIADVTAVEKRPAGAPSRGRVVVDIGEAPPPAPKTAPVVTITSAPSKEPRDLSGMPSVDQILDRYVEAIGGRAAFEKFTSRVSKGTIELGGMGLTGTVEVYQQAPNKSTSLINVEGLGTTQRTFDGAGSWMQDPVQGLVSFPGATGARPEYDFRRELHLKDLYPDLALIGKEKVGDREAYVLRSAATGPFGNKWFFDAQTGLLLRENNISYEDYRDVDGAKLAFTWRDDTARGFGVVIHLTEIKHNVAIEGAKFAEYPDCFAQPNGNWPIDK